MIDRTMRNRMMPQRVSRALGALSLGLLGAGLVAACGGAAKQADAPGTCPEGTVLRGVDCVPPESAADVPSSAKSADADKTPSAASAQGTGGEVATAAPPTAEPAAPSTAAVTPAAPSASPGKTPYDRDAVEVELKRATRQVKANCGSATDDDGKATGPWGTTKATVVLGRNGHIKQVTVPPPYDGKPVGICVVHAFEKILFPPYPGTTDVSVDWDVVIQQPKRR